MDAFFVSLLTFLELLFVDLHVESLAVHALIVNVDGAFRIHILFIYNN